MNDFSLYPPNPEKRAKIDFLLYWDMGDLYGSIMSYVYPQLGFRPMPADLNAEKEKFHAKLAFLNEHLIKVFSPPFY